MLYTRYRQSGTHQESSELAKRERKAKKLRFFTKSSQQKANKLRKDVKGREREVPGWTWKFVQNEIQAALYMYHKVSPLLPTFDLLALTNVKKCLCDTSKIKCRHDAEETQD